MCRDTHRLLLTAWNGPQEPMHTPESLKPRDVACSCGLMFSDTNGLSVEADVFVDTEAVAEVLTQSLQVTEAVGAAACGQSNDTSFQPLYRRVGQFLNLFH